MASRASSVKKDLKKKSQQQKSAKKPQNGTHAYEVEIKEAAEDHAAAGPAAAASSVAEKPSSLQIFQKILDGGFACSVCLEDFIDLAPNDAASACEAGRPEEAPKPKEGEKQGLSKPKQGEKQGLYATSDGKTYCASCLPGILKKKEGPADRKPLKLDLAHPNHHLIEVFASLRELQPQLELDVDQLTNLQTLNKALVAQLKEEQAKSSDPQIKAATARASAAEARIAEIEAKAQAEIAAAEKAAQARIAEANAKVAAAEARATAAEAKMAESKRKANAKVKEAEANVQRIQAGALAQIKAEQTKAQEQIAAEKAAEKLRADKKIGDMKKNNIAINAADKKNLKASKETIAALNEKITNLEQTLVQEKEFSLNAEKRHALFRTQTTELQAEMTESFRKTNAFADADRKKLGDALEAAMARIKVLEALTPPINELVGGLGRLQAQPQISKPTSAAQSEVSVPASAAQNASGAASPAVVTPVAVTSAPVAPESLATPELEKPIPPYWQNLAAAVAKDMLPFGNDVLQKLPVEQKNDYILSIKYNLLSKQFYEAAKKVRDIRESYGLYVSAYKCACCCVNKDIKDFDKHFENLEQSFSNLITKFNSRGDRELAQSARNFAQSCLSAVNVVKGRDSDYHLPKTSFHQITSQQEIDLEREAFRLGFIPRNAPHAVLAQSISVPSSAAASGTVKEEAADEFPGERAEFNEMLNSYSSTTKLMNALRDKFITLKTQSNATANDFEKLARKFDRAYERYLTTNDGKKNPKQTVETFYNTYKQYCLDKAQQLKASPPSLLAKSVVADPARTVKDTPKLSPSPSEGANTIAERLRRVEHEGGMELFDASEVPFIFGENRRASGNLDNRAAQPTAVASDRENPSRPRSAPRSSSELASSLYEILLDKQNNGVSQEDIANGMLGFTDVTYKGFVAGNPDDDEAGSAHEEHSAAAASVPRGAVSPVPSVVFSAQGSAAANSTTTVTSSASAPSSAAAFYSAAQNQLYAGKTPEELYADSREFLKNGIESKYKPSQLTWLAQALEVAEQILKKDPAVDLTAHFAKIGNAFKRLHKHYVEEEPTSSNVSKCQQYVTQCFKLEMKISPRFERK